jgi:hypothetical protein
MKTPAPTDRYKNHRFPAEIISHGIWLYYRFCLSYRDVEELLFARGVMVSYEAIRKWCRKFGQAYANQLRRRRARPGDKWHLDEVFLTIRGVRHYLWRAVDQDGNVLDILVQRRRDKTAAKKLELISIYGILGLPCKEAVAMGTLRFADLQTRPTEVLDLTSLTLNEFGQLVPPFEATFQAHMAHWRLDGQPRTARRYTTYTNCPLPTPEDRLLFILVYLKTYPLQVVQGRRQRSHVPPPFWPRWHRAAHRAPPGSG